MDTANLPVAQLDDLIQLLAAKGYLVIGPVLRGQAVVYDEIRGVNDLPQGWIDEQEKGLYRLHPSGDDRYFGYTVAANAWKKFLNPPRRLLWRVEHKDGRLTFTPESATAPPLAFIGVRSCELQAIRIQDAVFLSQAFQDADYHQRRRSLFTVAVNCTRAAATCFCDSMHTGPEVSTAADIILTEILNDQQHRFLVATGSEAGRDIVNQLSLKPADENLRKAANNGIEQARQQMRTGPRHFSSDDIQALLYRNQESTSWDEVAQRCLSCANCTLACPTCFCSSVEDTTDLSGEHAERWQQWESCFNADFTYIHGGSTRQSTRSRYRQWMTHKLASWIDQFGHSGCVGCGRCISWCPVGIDITEQLRIIREEESA